MKFSERIGKSQVDTTLQTEGINDSLRNSIWNVLDIFLWSRNNFLYKQYDSGDIEEFSERLWFHYFKEPMDSRPDSAHEILKVIRKYYFTGIWYEIYDFLEYILITERNSKLISAINDILERELSGYRFIDSAFIPVTDALAILSTAEMDSLMEFL